MSEPHIPYSDLYTGSHPTQKISEKKLLYLRASTNHGMKNKSTEVGSKGCRKERCLPLQSSASVAANTRHTVCVCVCVCVRACVRVGVFSIFTFPGISEEESIT